MKICYFGIYDSNFSRNKVYMRGMRELGITIIECQDDSPGLMRKYWQLWKKHQALALDYDALIVGYPGHIVVPLAKLISRKVVIADLLGSLYDAEIHSHRASAIKKWKTRIIDWLAVRWADRILLESVAQKNYFDGRFGTSDKYKVIYTGVDEGVYSRDQKQEAGSKKQEETHGDKFTVLFRGKLTPECGIGHILNAAEILKGHMEIRFKIVGRGYLLEEVERTIGAQQLNNVELISKYLSDDEMREAIQGASLYLGQFEDNHRLKRTIPHKAFEAFVAGVPYMTEDASAARELIVDGETGFLIPVADPKMVAKKILELSKNAGLLQKVSENAKRMYEEKLTPKKLAAEIMKLVTTGKK